MTDRSNGSASHKRQEHLFIARDLGLHSASFNHRFISQGKFSPVVASRCHRHKLLLQLNCVSHRMLIGSDHHSCFFPPLPSFSMSHSQTRFLYIPPFPVPTIHLQEGASCLSGYHSDCMKSWHYISNPARYKCQRSHTFLFLLLLSPLCVFHPSPDIFN